MIAATSAVAWEADVTPEELRSMLKPFPAARMRAYQISSLVNSAKNDDESLLAPLS